jgi:hypothetical protein
MDFYKIKVRVPFPLLTPTNHRKTSEATPSYNCFGWAIVGQEVLMAPRAGWLWPAAAPRDMKLSSFVVAIAEFGFSSCANGDVGIGVEKIVLYGLQDYVDHAARQLPNGRWTSKRGLYGDDIEHDTAESISGGEYGPILGFFARRDETFAIHPQASK